MEKFKVLLIASYCGDVESGCTEDKPCVDCLGMCNTFEIDKEAIKMENYKGTLDYLTK